MWKTGENRGTYTDETHFKRSLYFVFTEIPSGRKPIFPCATVLSDWNQIETRLLSYDVGFIFYLVDEMPFLEVPPVVRRSGKNSKRMANTAMHRRHLFFLSRNTCLWARPRDNDVSWWNEKNFFTSFKHYYRQ